MVMMRRRWWVERLLFPSRDLVGVIAGVSFGLIICIVLEPLLRPTIAINRDEPADVVPVFCGILLGSMIGAVIAVSRPFPPSSNLEPPRAGGGSVEASSEVPPSPFGSLPYEILLKIELLLPVSDVVSLGAVGRLYWRQQMSNDVFRLIFLSRWGTDLDANPDTGVSPSLHSAMVALWNDGVYFWRTLERAFLFQCHFVPGLDINETLRRRPPESRQTQISVMSRAIKMFGGSNKVTRSFSSQVAMVEEEEEVDQEDLTIDVGGPLSSPWKLACSVRERKGDIFLRCSLCNQLEVYTESMRTFEKLPHQSQSWLRPCRCRGFAMRRCLERKLITRRRFKRVWFTLDRPVLESLRQLASSAAGEADDDATPLGACAECCSPFLLGLRLPQHALEVLTATLGDLTAWRWLTAANLYWSALVGLVLLLENFAVSRREQPRSATGGGMVLLGLRWPEPGGCVLLWWLWQQVVLLCIMHSRRFMRVVRRLWRGPIFAFYCKLYAYFVAANVLLVCSFTPLVPRVLGPELIAPNVAQWPWWVHLVRYANAGSLFAISGVVIALFWKTNYRFATVAAWTPNNALDAIAAAESENRDDQHPVLDVW